jgi:Fe-S-cluster-containing dehydrogenase component
MNGLDEGETWHDVGVLFGGTVLKPVQQTITTACHHCVDPACMNGCPVNAYDKDPVTGIVRHLDDQCIGCQYCIWKCPYNVPKYSKKRGIVRKCDMCSSRRHGQSCLNRRQHARRLGPRDRDQSPRRLELYEVRTAPDGTSGQRCDRQLLLRRWPSVGTNPLEFRLALMLDISSN